MKIQMVTATDIGAIKTNDPHLFLANTVISKGFRVKEQMPFHMIFFQTLFFTLITLIFWARQLICGKHLPE